MYHSLFEILNSTKCNHKTERRPQPDRKNKRWNQIPKRAKRQKKPANSLQDLTHTAVSEDEAQGMRAAIGGSRPTAQGYGTVTKGSWVQTRGQKEHCEPTAPILSSSSPADPTTSSWPLGLPTLPWPFLFSSVDHIYVHTHLSVIFLVFHHNPDISWFSFTP